MEDKNIIKEKVIIPKSIEVGNYIYRDFKVDGKIRRMKVGWKPLIKGD